jgi:hypothetical protein
MAEIMGAGCTHYPPLITPDEDRGFPINVTLNHDDRLPDELKDPLNWPEAMRLEYGNDEGLASAGIHRQRLVAGFRRVRRAVLDFAPDFVVIFGDDQYENFREDIIPPFCIMAYDQVESLPFNRGDGSARPNVWGEPAETAFKYRGHPEAARYLASGLIDSGIDIAYAYRPLHEPGLAHAFINTLLYLDYDREGFDVPVVPIAVNCYGSKVISNRGGILPYKAPDGQTLDPDPPGPTPERCMAVGAALGRVLKDSPYRVAIIASSSWSHGFLTAKNNYLWPDTPADRVLFEELKKGNYEAWGLRTTADMEASGQHELLNWACMLGAMAELKATPEIIDFVESHVFTSNKCFATFRT